MDDEEPPNITIRVYRTIIGQYYPIVISNNGNGNKTLENFSNREHIFGTYRINSRDFDVFYNLCEKSFKSSRGIVKKRIEKLVGNGNGK